MGGKGADLRTQLADAHAAELYALSSLPASLRACRHQPVPPSPKGVGGSGGRRLEIPDDVSAGGKESRDHVNSQQQSSWDATAGMWQDAPLISGEDEKGAPYRVQGVSVQSQLRAQHASGDGVVLEELDQEEEDLVMLLRALRDDLSDSSIRHLVHTSQVLENM